MEGRSGVLEGAEWGKMVVVGVEREVCTVLGEVEGVYMAQR